MKNINQKSIRNMERYLYDFSPDEALYVVAYVSDQVAVERMLEYGLQLDGVARIPLPKRGASIYNADGKWKIRKDLPKEARLIRRKYHVIDWHGCDHYGTCWQRKMCYQRELIPPMKIAFKVEGDMVYSPLFHNNDKEMEKIRVASNVLLEIFGSCALWTSDKKPPMKPMRQEKVSWEILRSGILKEKGWRNYIEQVTSVPPRRKGYIIKQHHEHLWNQGPDFCAIGKKDFFGYIVYGFSAIDLYIFECTQFNNATYIFKGDWKELSKLTKTEILDAHLQEVRLFHTKNWHKNVQKAIDRQQAEKIA